MEIEGVGGAEIVVKMYCMRRNYLKIKINAQDHITINCKIINNDDDGDDDDKNKSFVMAGHSVESRNTVSSILCFG